jgi:D-glycero-alpha-D-manno-heptose-7-phosphate kinase
MSFVGGGTDFSDYYKIYGGEVISSTIDSYITVTVEDSPDDRIYLDYFFDNEVVHFVDEIKHDILRECLRHYGMDDVRGGIRITVTTDMPVLGSGLGSSSCLTVGTLLALYNYNGKSCDSQVELAVKACEIEIGILNRAIGKQDQYGTAIGGFKRIVFTSDDCDVKPEVLIHRIKVCEERKLELKNNLMLYYTGVQRNATDILEEQVEKMEFNISTLQSYGEMVKEFKKILTSDVSLDYVGLILNECWESKKTLSSKITNPFFDRVYDDVMSVGAIGGKLLGAGGGGFFLFYVKPESQYAVRKVMNNFREYKFNFEDEGSVII